MDPKSNNDTPIQNSLLLTSNFLVNLGDSSFSFSRIRNISDVLETESVREGGDNWHVHTLFKQLSSPQKLVLERGMLADPAGKVPIDLKPGTLIARGTIMVRQRGKTVKSYGFHQGIITKWELSDLDALQGNVIYQTVEITHSGLYEKNI